MTSLFRSFLPRRALLTAFVLVAAPLLCRAGMGTDVLAARGEDGPVTLYYPTDAQDEALQRGPFLLHAAEHAAPRRGNGHLIVISHGSGGSALTYADAAHALVDAGFVVAAPEHRGDNFHDHSRVGPPSWERRPTEVSDTIDAVAADPRFAAQLDFSHVGMYGMSAGGHTALVLAGGVWSPARHLDYCEHHIREDFYSCAGLFMRQWQGPLQGLQERFILWGAHLRFDDAGIYSHTDPRIAAIVAAVPLAVNFDMQSLQHPKVPLALMTAGHDAWLVPRNHALAVLANCSGCEHLLDLPLGGHGAYISPSTTFEGLAGELLNDPPGFDRAASTRLIDSKLVEFFSAHLR